MRHVKELGDSDLRAIAFTVRKRMIADYGETKVIKFLDPREPLCLAFIRQSYIALREHLEKGL